MQRTSTLSLRWRWLAALVGICAAALPRQTLMDLRHSTTLNLAISVLDHSSLAICLPPINYKRTVGEYRAADTDGEIMLRTFFSLALKRGRWIVMLAGLAAFAASFGALTRISTLALAEAFRLSFSLRIGTTGSYVPYQSLDQGHAAFMPDAG
jgi:hypothetical protein